MTIGTLEAKRYAQAIFEMAQERNTLDEWLQDLNKINLLAKDADFVSYMQNPKFSFEIKSRLLSKQLPGINPIVMNLVLLLTSKGRFGLIPLIRNGFADMVNDLRGIATAEITTAVPLEEKDRQGLVKHLETISGKKILLSSKVNPDIIGGIIIKFNGKLIDGSTSSRLSALKGELANSQT